MNWAKPNRSHIKLYAGPGKARTYTVRVPQTTETITWTRPGGIWTETEVGALSRRFKDAWERLFGELERMAVYADGNPRAMWRTAAD